MNDYSYPAELIKKLQTRILKQIEGNRVDPKATVLRVNWRFDKSLSSVR